MAEDKNTKHKDSLKYIYWIFCNKTKALSNIENSIT